MGGIVNNYNCSSSGLNIEVSVFKDTWLSKINFDDNIARFDFDKDLFLYTDFGNLTYHMRDKYKNDKLDISSCWEVRDFIKIDNSKPLRFYLKFILEYLGYTLPYDYFKGFTVDYAIDFIIDNYTDFEELQEHLDDFEKIDYKLLVDIIEVTGYSQGDYARVVIFSDLIKEIWGSEEIDLDALSTDITHYFYDAPMTARVTVNGEEFISEKYDGMYEEWNELEYDKSDFIAEITENFEDIDSVLLKAELEEILPSELSYDV